MRTPKGAPEALRLPGSHWKQLHRVRCAATHPGTVIDHALVGPSGVYVVLEAAAHHPGDASRSAEAAHEVAAVLPARYRACIRPVLCVRDDDSVAEFQGEVLITSMATLEHIARSSPVVLSTSEVAEVANRLSRGLEPLPDPAAAGRRRWSTRRRVLTAALAALGAAAAAVGAVAATGTDLGRLTGLG